jgi:hypothetical protein
VPPAAPAFLRIDSPLLLLARREMQVLADAAPGYAELLIHMLNRPYHALRLFTRNLKRFTPSSTVTGALDDCYFL